MTRFIASSRFSFRRGCTLAWLLTLAMAPWLVSLACSENSSSQPEGEGGDSGAGGVGGTPSALGGDGPGGLGGMTALGGDGPGGATAVGGSGGGGGGNTNLPDAGPEPDAGGSDASVPAFTLTSTAVEDVAGCGPDDGAKDLCALFPPENTDLGSDPSNVSPQFDWTGAPAGTQSFAIALHDLSDVTARDPFTHWVMWNIPGSATGLPAELPAGANPGAPAPAGSRQVSYVQNLGYAGSGVCGHVYEFTLYALSSATFLPSDESDADAVEADLEASNTLLGTATLRARSDPNGPC